MAKVEFLEAEDVELEEYTVTNAPTTSADLATDSLVAALNDVSGSATVSLHRQNGSGKESLTFLDSFSPDKYAPDDLLLHIKNSYGSGDYRIHVRENGRLKANKHVSIEAPKIVSRETSGNNSGMDQLIAMIQQQNRVIVETLQSNQNQNQGNSKAEFLKEMMIYKELFGGAPQKSQGFGEILQTVNGLKELGINVGGIQTEKEEGFGDILDKMSPMITALLSQPQQPPQQPQYKPNPQPRNPQETEAKKVNLALKMGLMALVKAAKNNSDTAFYADMIIDQFPSDKLEMLFASDALEQLIKIEPKVLEYKEWFLDVLEHLKGICGKPSKYSDQYNDENLTGENEKDITDKTEKTAS